jgi:hypothetical protein
LNLFSQAHLSSAGGEIEHFHRVPYGEKNSGAVFAEYAKRPYIRIFQQLCNQNQKFSGVYQGTPWACLAKTNADQKISWLYLHITLVWYIFLSKIYRQFLGRSQPGASVWDKGIYTVCASLSKFSLHSSFPAPNFPLLLTKRKDGYEHKIMCMQFHGQAVA